MKLDSDRCARRRPAQSFDPVRARIPCVGPHERRGLRLLPEITCAWRTCPAPTVGYSLTPQQNTEGEARRADAQPVRPSTHRRAREKLHGQPGRCYRESMTEPP